MGWNRLHLRTNVVGSYDFDLFNTNQEIIFQVLVLDLLWKYCLPKRSSMCLQCFLVPWAGWPRFAPSQALSNQNAMYPSSLSPFPHNERRWGDARTISTLWMFWTGTSRCQGSFLRGTKFWLGAVFGGIWFFQFLEIFDFSSFWKTHFGGIKGTANMVGHFSGISRKCSVCNKTLDIQSHLLRRYLDPPNSKGAKGLILGANC